MSTSAAITDPSAAMIGPREGFLLYFFTMEDFEMKRQRSTASFSMMEPQPRAT
jgi:hypothetical protein